MRLSDLSREASKVIEEVLESVVTISTTKLAIDAFSAIPREVRGVGSGFVVSEDGYVVTNSHVVRGARRVAVYLRGGEVLEGRVVASDPYRDLALLRIPAKPKPLRLGDSDKVRVGEIVFAIGSPLGFLGSSVTMGVVSAVGRTISGGGVVLEDLIQTDAAINPGNSGGPLINAEGEAIGVTTAIIPYTQGIGFAIPINTVKRFLEIIKRYGRPVVAWIGVYVAQITPGIARIYDLPVDKGVIVVNVMPNTPAHLKGLRVGDIIVRAGGLEIKKPSDLRKAIEDKIEEEAIELEVIRGTIKYKVIVPIIVEAI